jgi:hypothetical protein
MIAKQYHVSETMSSYEIRTIAPHGGIVRIGTAYTKEDARAFAAAPELIAACEDFLAALSIGADTETDFIARCNREGGAIDLMRVALAKMKGF